MPYDKELIAHKLIRWEHYLNNYKLPAWKELPDIGLYMDQVIALLGQYLDFIPMEDSKDKPVTPTTINNYVRLKVMPEQVWLQQTALLKGPVIFLRARLYFQ